MPRPKKTEKEIHAMREKILDMAFVILQEEGPDAITSRAIAERLNIAHMGLFTYFKNQAAIISALRERELSKWRASQDEFELRGQTEDISVLVEELLSFYITFARENPRLYRLAWVMPETGIMSPEEKWEQTMANVEHLAKLLKAGMFRGDFETRDPFLAASTVLGMINMPFILFHNRRLRDTNMLDRMVNEVLTIALSYLRNANKANLEP